MFLSIVPLLFAQAGNASAQDRLQFFFTGMAYTTNTVGAIVAQRVNTATWIAQFVSDFGLTNSPNLAVAYHLNGNELGDNLEVVNTQTGENLGLLFGLYKGDSDGRTILANNKNTDVRVIQYVYGHQIDHSVGSALITEKYTVNSHGITNRSSITGQMHFVIMQDGYHPMTVTQGTFFTGKVLNISGP